MSNMREIRERIKSINDIMKITNAMYLISSSKLKKAKKDLAATEPYFDKLLYAMRSILSRAPEDIDMRFFDTRTEIPADKRKKAFIIITADKGMCGSYNHNVIKRAEAEMEQCEYARLFVGTGRQNVFSAESKRRRTGRGCGIYPDHPEPDLVPCDENRRADDGIV